MKTLLTPKQQYAAIRKQNPKPFGDHWEGDGVYLGDTWGDPEYMGMPGEYQFMHDAHRCRQDAPGRALKG